jgi:hypothetical protein
MVNSCQQEPGITPKAAYIINDISTFNFAKKGSHYKNGEKEQHQQQKTYKGIYRIQCAYWFFNIHLNNLRYLI